MRHMVIGVLALIAAAQPAAQAGDNRPAFEVASVKPSPPGDETAFFANAAAATFALTNMPVRTMISQAYGIPPILERFTLIGGPAQILSARFDIRAKPPERATREQRLLMLQSLLVERFKLRTHTETRQIPLYVLTVAHEGKFGPDFRSSEHDCVAWQRSSSQAARDGRELPPEPKDARGRGWCRSNYDFNQPGGVGLHEAGPLSQLFLKVQAFLDRPLVDGTGLSGSFEWQLAFTAAANPPIDSPVPSIYTAFEEQLGLKLERRTGPFEVRVIDSVDRPTPD